MGSNPLLLLKVSAECIDDQISSVTPEPSRQILSYIRRFDVVSDHVEVVVFR